MTSPYLPPLVQGVGISTGIRIRRRLLWLRRADPSTTLDKVSRKYSFINLAQGGEGVKNAKKMRNST